MARVMEKVAQIRRGDPLDTDTMIGAQASRQEYKNHYPAPAR
jgi:aldehyde dehydrogenase